MRTGKEFNIQFVGLSLGEHVFEYTLSETFFANLNPDSEIKKGKIDVTIRLLKQSTMMILQFEITGTVNVNCDRCTDEFDLPINGNYQLVVKFGGHDTGEEDDDIITLSTHESELDVSQYIYEYVMLSLPIRRVHPDNTKGKSTCNKEMLKKLNDFLVDEQPKEGSNPHWDNLKNIKLN